MADNPTRAERTLLQRGIRVLGVLLVAGSLFFIARELWRLDWSSLRQLFSGELAVATLTAAILFFAGNQMLARAWVRLAGMDGPVDRAALVAIYARSVLLKYVPGSVFQYLGRHAEAAEMGVPHGALARSHGQEIALHVVASLSVAALCLVGVEMPIVSVVAAGVIVVTFLVIGRPLTAALLLQLLTFSAFAFAAAIVGSAVLPGDVAPAQFAALFLLAWLAGFLVPFAPGGLGVREAALLALTAAILPAEAVLAAILVLRLASISADLGYGLSAMRSRNKPAI